MAHIFICYSRQDASAVDDLVARLEERGGQVWVDRAGIPGGELWRKSIVNAIETCEAVLVVLSPNSVTSSNVRKELDLAEEMHKQLLPVMLEGVSIPPDIKYQLAGIQIIDLSTQDSFERLAAALGLGKKPPEKTEKPAAKAPVLNVQELFEQGTQHLEAASFDEAIDCFTVAILFKPDDARTYNSRGVARAGKGDPDGAIQDLNEAIRLKPDYADAFNNRGIVRSKKGDLDEAIQDYTTAIRLKPDYAVAYFKRGNAHREKSDLDEAVQDYTAAIRLKPDYAEAYNNRGIARKRKSDLDGAIQDYTAAIRLKPDYALAYYNRGIAYYDKGDLDGAIKDYTEAIRLKPDDPSAKENLAAALKSKSKKKH